MTLIHFKGLGVYCQNTFQLLKMVPERWKLVCILASHSFPIILKGKLLGRLSEWGWFSEAQSTFFLFCSFWPMHTHACTCTSVHIHIHEHAQTCMSTHTNIHAYKHTHTCTDPVLISQICDIKSSISTHAGEHIHACLHTHACSLAQVCMHIHTNIHVHIH